MSRGPRPDAHRVGGAPRPVLLTLTAEFVEDRAMQPGPHTSLVATNTIAARTSPSPCRLRPYDRHPADVPEPAAPPAETAPTTRPAPSARPTRSTCDSVPQDHTKRNDLCRVHGSGRTGGRDPPRARGEGPSVVAWPSGLRQAVGSGAPGHRAGGTLGGAAWCCTQPRSTRCRSGSRGSSWSVSRPPTWQPPWLASRCSPVVGDSNSGAHHAGPRTARHKGHPPLPYLWVLRWQLAHRRRPTHLTGEGRRHRTAVQVRRGRPASPARRAGSAGLSPRRAAVPSRLPGVRRGSRRRRG